MNNRTARHQVSRLGWLLVLLTTLVLAACGGQEASPTETPAPPPRPTSTSTPEAPAGDDAWSRIQATGRMVVATSADYPPFSFYTRDFQLDGFDIALIREVAGRLGVDVEIRDMAFDGLGGALVVNQVDAAIAALSVTDERAAVIDFSNVYFISEDAILARSGSNIRINTVRDLARFRVGAQAGSVYQEWLERELVETGLMPASNLFLYTNTDTAIEDLADQRIDLLVADLQPLELAEQTGVFEIVSQGLNRQRFAIALPKGSTLTPVLNDALISIQNDGTLADLVETHLQVDVEDILPVPTPGPEPTATSTPVPPPAGCVDAMQFIGDLNLDDQNMTAPPQVAPGTPFQKGWRIRNIGTCTWDARYQFVYVDGNTPQARMGGLPTPIQGSVPPGALYDMYVSLVAPLTPGVYQGFWSLRNDRGLLFGDRVWVGITVPGAPTPTPVPTVPPSASISFTANRTNITAGECVVFNWTVQNARNAYFYAQGQQWSQNEVPLQGQRNECPPVTRVYELRVVNLDNTVEIRSIRIDVSQPPPNAPVIESFSVTPNGQVQAGSCLDVRWRVTGEVNSIRVSRGGNVLWDGAPLSGTTRDCPPTGVAEYVIDVSGPGGNARAQENVTVVPPPTPPPQVTPTPVPPTATPVPPPQQQPVINSFAVSPNQINAGQCVTINWSAGGNVNLVQLKRNGAVVVDNGPLNGNVSDCLAAAGTYTYRIEASNAAGATAFQQATVTVGSPPPPAGNPLQGTSWRLLTLNGAPVVAGTEITLVFGDGGRLSGNGGCNAYNGQYSVNQSSLTVSGISQSQLNCPAPPEVMPQERSYINVLGSSSGFNISGSELTIRGTQGSLVYERMIEPR